MNKEKLNQLLTNLKSRRITAYFVKNKAEALKKALQLIPKGSTIGLGGSMTVEQIRILPELEKLGHKIFNHYSKNLSPEQRSDIRTKGTLADIFLTSTNAITMDGRLVNIDGRSNRVVGVMYNANKVIIIASINKICDSLETAMERVRNYAAPLNSLRLKKGNPCEKVNKCVDCRTSERICCNTVIAEYQTVPDRVHLILINEELGI